MKPANAVTVARAVAVAALKAEARGGAWLDLLVAPGDRERVALELRGIADDLEAGQLQVQLVVPVRGGLHHGC